MHVGALQALEFDRIVEALASFAATPLGAARLAALRPQTDPRRVAAQLAATSEGVRYLDIEGRLTLRSPGDLEGVLSALAIEGRALEPLRLIGLADFLESIETARAAIRRTAPAFPALRAVADAAASFKNEIADVRQKIDTSGAVVDNASAELRALRDRLRRLRGRLQGLLESFLRGKETARYLQEQIVTDRNGRYVLMIKAENRSAIPGIVHGSSASGATLFLEPLSTVELNNEIVALEEQEAAEVRRILLALTNGFRNRPADISRTVEAAVELDVIQSKAEFAHLVGGSEPVLSPDGTLELRSARHPLLIAAVNARLADPRGDAGHGDSDVDNAGGDAARDTKAHAAEPVPVDILVTPPTSVLVVTGPNTGGKTVALKTAGVLSLMAQAGLHIPAAPGSRLPVFRSVFADIGDEQSIAASLSTFSWHITNIASMDRRLSLPALVLLDEIGVGTDPIEGGALGIAIIDHFRKRGAVVIATTHYEALKSYASTTEGVQAAGFGFDPETFAPTYRLIYGSPGRSLALEISGRLGLSPAILSAARANISDREAQLAAHLQKVDEDLRTLEHERRLVAREREALRDGEDRLRSRETSLREREEAAKRRFDKQVDERIREARQEVERIVGDLKRKAAELAERAAKPRLVASLSTGDTGAVRTEALQALEQAAQKLRGEESAEAKSGLPTEAGRSEDGRPAKVGDRVIVRALGLEGRVVGLTGHEADVEVRGKRMRVPEGDLRVIAGPTAAAASVHVNVPSHAETPQDLNIIGCTVDEAVTRAEKFLDDVLLGDQRTVRIIHGYGTGQLRRGITEFLQRHPLVATFAPAAPEHGGGGVTVVELKD
ncbi:MAG: endonuclease MutS2 [Bacteroidales bacterium]